jgi:hypothetical protein
MQSGKKILSLRSQRNVHRRSRRSEFPLRNNEGSLCRLGKVTKQVSSIKNDLQRPARRLPPFAPYVPDTLKQCHTTCCPGGLARPGKNSAHSRERSYSIRSSFRGVSQVMSVVAELLSAGSCRPDSNSPTAGGVPGRALRPGSRPDAQGGRAIARRRGIRSDRKFGGFKWDEMLRMSCRKRFKRLA